MSNRKTRKNLHYYLQGDPNQSLLFQMAITLKICISDPILVKPKLFLACLSLFSKIVNKQVRNQNKLRHPKHILALPTWGQKRVFSEL